MPAENIAAIVGTIIGSVITFILTRKKYEAEVEKLKAEAEKSKADADKSRAEAEKLRAETEKILQELAYIHSSNQPDEAGKSPDREITVLITERSLLSKYYLEQILSSVRIDMIALTLQSALEHFGKGRFIQWIKDGKHIRILMLSPFSSAAKLRGIEEDSNENFLSDKITLQVKALKSLYSQAEEQLKNLNVTGSLEIRLYDDLPYFSYFHADNVMVMGLYYVHIRGLQSEALLIDEKSSIHTKMCDHFDKIWTRSVNRDDLNMTVCIISKMRMEFNNALLDGLQAPAQ